MGLSAASKRLLKRRSTSGQTYGGPGSMGEKLGKMKNQYLAEMAAARPKKQFYGGGTRL